METCDCTTLGIIDILIKTKCYLQCFIENHGTLTYFLLCLIIFCETGLVATPFLPGDSLLFTAGMFAAIYPSVLNPFMLIILLIISAILGDNVNYLVGRKLGVRIFEIKWLKKIIKREYLTKTELFYQKHGGKTIIMARFVPIVRTFAPFAAGMGNMNYKKYISFCVIGGIIWVTALTLAGYFLGTNAWIQKNYEKVVFGIIGISVLPILFGFIKSKFSKQ
ncbi:MAG: VTT domain-containing protein [Bacteroidia bacterium]|jgi:membrane-associated protein